MAFMNFSKTALKNLFSKPATLGYPFTPREYPERSRGHVEINIDDCIMCGMCMRKCPSDAIKVDRNTKTWSIERMACVQCSNCVNNCPKSCLSINPGYTEPSDGKTVDSFSQPVPETPEGNITNDIDNCILCGLCAKNCPEECITVDRANKTWTIDYEKCVGCGMCMTKCPKKCLSKDPKNTQSGTVTVSKEEKAAAPKAEETAKADAPKTETGKIVNDFEKCFLCTLCARKCPQEAITVDRDAKTWSIDRDKCVQCGICIDACLKVHALSFSKDDGETGTVTFKKEQ